MTRRLGCAMVEAIRQMDGGAKFIVVEAATQELATALCEYWEESDSRLPRLAVASAEPAHFGPFGLRHASAATLRNENPQGVCVVICEGYVLAERQSINNFVPLSPGDLLSSKNSLMLLADAIAPVRRDGPIAAVRDAIVTLPAGERPSANRVSKYFDAVSLGQDPMDALPLLGGFRDPGQSIADVRSDRIKANLSLAASRRSEAVIKQGAYAGIRAQAERVLGRRPNGSDLSTRFMQLLEAGGDEILSEVTFDEAREILTTDSKGLPATVKAELDDYRRRLRQLNREDVDALPWEDYSADAGALGRAADRRAAARDLLSFDLTEEQEVFSTSTRRKLDVLLHDRSVNATSGSAPEVGIARAIVALSAPPLRVKLDGPHPVNPPNSQTAAREWLSLAIARVRLAGPLARLEAEGAVVDGELMLEAFHGIDRERVRDLFEEAGLGRSSLATIKLKLSSRSQSVELTWTPDIDDAALLRCLIEFTDATSLTLRIPGPPEPHVMAANRYVEAVKPPKPLKQLATRMQQMAIDALQNGLRAHRLRGWVADWTVAVEEERGFGATDFAEAAALAGCVEGPSSGGQRTIGMSALAPIKAEWLADYLESSLTVVEDSLRLVAIPDKSLLDGMAFDVAGSAVAGATASHCPAFVRLTASNSPLLPSKESRLWTLFGGPAGVMTFESHGIGAVTAVLHKLLRLQPEAAGHLRCMAVGPGATGLLLREAVRLSGQSVGGVRVSLIEIFSVGPHMPDEASLVEADEHRMRGDSGTTIQLRYLNGLDEAAAAVGASRPALHFALMTGLTSGGGHPTVNSVEVVVPELDDEVIFGPRVWQRPDTAQRTLLMPPGLTAAGLAWLRLAQAVDDRWPEVRSKIEVPEMRTSAAAVAGQLRTIHQLSMWVATLDRYATRDSLERALGGDVAILHQERRLLADCPIGLVVSQKAGGPVDRAVGRSLRQARIVQDEGTGTSIGADLRRVAAQGYGILALEAATSGTGINELVGHVVGFSLLGTASTPWPLPPDCRVLLVSLDEHADWFSGGKRADLLALAVDTNERGLHGAIIEVKARRSDAQRAESEALDQLRKTLMATSFAAYPQKRLQSRVWLNRIAEAAYAVARESQIRLTSEELESIEQFRRGRSTLEWAGLALIFGPDLHDQRRVHRQPVENDWVPIAMHNVRLTQERLRQAVNTDLRNLRTSEATEPPLGGGRQRRRPETGAPRGERPRDHDPNADRDVRKDAVGGSTDVPETHAGTARVNVPTPQTSAPSVGTSEFRAPVIGWNQLTQEPLLWRFAGKDKLENGHVQIWGSSGAGKTQFIKMLLAQLAIVNGTRFGIVDFKNDYGPTPSEDFPSVVGAEFIDMWGRPGARYNPLSLGSRDEVVSRVIELRDSIEQAMASYQRIGSRQKVAIENALRRAYAATEAEGRWPTMLDLNHEVGSDVIHILGDLTKYEIFSDGPSLDSVVDLNVVFGLSRIPGNGQTTVLAASFLLAVISLAMQSRPPVHGTVTYALVIDEAHRVSQIRALDIMVREGRSKGLAVLLATQAPGDLPPVVDTNAQARICFRLSDAVVASQAARKLDPSDESLAERIRTLATGEALVSLQGATPQLVQMAQYYRHRELVTSDGIGLPPDFG